MSDWRWKRLSLVFVSDYSLNGWYFQVKTGLTQPWVLAQGSTRKNLREVSFFLVPGATQFWTRVKESWFTFLFLLLRAYVHACDWVTVSVQVRPLWDGLCLRLALSRRILIENQVLQLSPLSNSDPTRWYLRLVNTDLLRVRTLSENGRMLRPRRHSVLLPVSISKVTALKS